MLNNDNLRRYFDEVDQAEESKDRWQKEILLKNKDGLQKMRDKSRDFRI